MRVAVQLLVQRGVPGGVVAVIGPDDVDRGLDALIAHVERAGGRLDALVGNTFG